MTQKTNLETFFQPRSVAVVGATDQQHEDGSKKPGQAICENILGSGYAGNVYFVNPTREIVLGKKTFPNIGSLPETPDLVVIVTPAATVPGIIEECAAKRVPSAVIISAGFMEAGEKGIEIAKRTREVALSGGVSILGPNGVGVVGKNFNATFLTQAKVGSGNVALATQSGGIMCGLSDLALDDGIGLLKAASLGGMLGVSWKEMLENFSEDPAVAAIVLYMETIGENGRDFLAAATEASRKKMVIAIKGGKSAAAAQATLTHSGGLAGDNDVINAAFRRAALVTARDSQELAWLLEWNKKPLPKGNRLSIVTNGGGPAILAVDELIASGGVPAKLPERMSADLLKVLSPDPERPRAVSIGNTIDIMGDASPDMYEAAVKAALNNPESDGVIITFVPVAVVDAKVIAEKIVPLCEKAEKPVGACFMGERSVGPARKVFHDAGIPVFNDPAVAARMFGRLAEREKWSDEAKEAAIVIQEAILPTTEKNEVDELLQTISDSGRVILTECESKRVLRAYGIPANETVMAETEDAAVVEAERLGFPVVLKLNSFTLTHKTEAGGVALDLKNSDDVRAAFRKIQSSVGVKGFAGVSVQKMETMKGAELILGAKTDPSFGHVIVFGEGGILAEYRKDTAVSLVPVDSIRAHILLEKTRIYSILKDGWRGSVPADISGLQRVIVALSRFLETHSHVDSVDINPLIILGDRMSALDARIILKK